MNQPETPETGEDRIARIQWLYTLAVKRHGCAPKGVGWRDRAGQLLRFAQLVRLMEGEPHGASVTVNDLGCGYGALFPFLLTQKAVRVRGYVGYDMTRAMVAQARSAIRDHRARFLLSDRATVMADYGFASGTFNVLAGGDADAWRAEVIAQLKAFAAMNRKGFAFNMLGLDHPRRDQLMFYTAPDAFRDAFEAAGMEATVLDGYMPGDWTMLVRY
ncbi:SAM (and some other nucleotide) binding protein [Caenispirillum salinarum AK4]|uniref:SAM (And some other nucleotide) binding protein n=1 Tax=Caenispirillum salinarum AK4 TaxID=1238182 RepID=K9HXG9_9PROT|nr:class I SAM-dependent methyltransferase [Caenispirillum salinarum]EKV32881.1 SAM (and some other nucleotide) binding protein [Caenispirillum salinarum AK4]